MRDKQNERQISDARIENSTLVTLLTEAVGGPKPPDLSAQILQRLYDHPLSINPTELKSATPAAAPKSQRNLAAVLSLIAAIAAVVLVMVALRHIPSNAPQQEIAVQSSPNDSLSSQATALSGDPHRTGNTAAGGTTPNKVASTPRSRPMSMGSAPFATGDAPAPIMEAVAFDKPERVKPQSGSVIAEELQQRFELAWQHLAVVPTEPVSNEQVAKRISEWLDVPVSPEQATNPQAIASLLRKPSARTEVSRRVLAELLGPAWPRLHKDPKQTLTQFVAASLDEGQRFDSVTQQLFAGADNDNARDASAAWLSALAGERSVPVTQQVGHALLDMDLACARCHDDPIDSQIRQQDFWALAAVFENGLQYSRNKSGEPLVQPTRKPEPPKGQFFELPDGRQQVADPALPLAWLDLQADVTTGANVLLDLESVTAQWEDNPRLARSLVNRVWTAVYGRPLTGPPSDPDAPPSEDHLVQLRDYLAAQTRAHDFDLAALVSWVLTAPPMQRGVVIEPLSDVAAFASDDQLARAEFMHRTFAGYESAPAKLGFGGLLSMASRWNGGGTIESLPALAQPSSSDSTYTPPKLPSEAERTENWLRTSFPEKRTEATQLPAQWLGSIDDFDQQARHLYYAAGYWKPSNEQMQAANELNASSGNSAIALKQLWWALRNSR